MYKIFQGNITQTNTGTLKGKLFNSFNCDLTYNEGKMSIAPRSIITTDTISNMTTPVGFKYFDTKWFTPAGRMLVNNGTAQGVFAEDTSTGVPTTTINQGYSDIEVFGDVLLVTTTDQLYSKATNAGAGNGAYTSRRTFTVSGASPSHMLCVYNSRAYWVDTRGQIYSFDTAYTSAVTTGTDYTFKVPDGQDIVWMRPHSAGIYIGTLDPNGSNAYVYDWDGVTAITWRGRYGVASQGVLAGYVDVNGTLYVVTSDARFLQFTGSGFLEKGKLPIRRNLLYKATSIIINDRFIHPNGLTAIDGVISMLINNRENSTTSPSYLENIHSGIWEYTESNGLYHKTALGYKTFAGAITDYGQITLNVVGGLANVSDIFEITDNAKGNFLAGASYFTTSSISTGLGYGIFTDNYFDDMEKSGFFSTVQIRASDIKEMWKKITTLYDTTTGFNFVVKYRTDKPEYNAFDIIFTSTNTFTTTQTGLAVGDEITIIQGKGSGRVAHVSAISFSAPNFTVTLDETITGVANTDTARARQENWIKLKAITKTNQKYEERLISDPDTLIELKVAMLCTGENTIDELILDNSKNI